MSWIDTPLSDLEYRDIEDFECPYNHQCSDCEWDCQEDQEGDVE